MDDLPKINIHDRINYSKEYIDSLLHIPSNKVNINTINAQIDMIAYLYEEGNLKYKELFTKYMQAINKDLDVLKNKGIEFPSNQENSICVQIVEEHKDKPLKFKDIHNFLYYWEMDQSKKSLDDNDTVNAFSHLHSAKFFFDTYELYIDNDQYSAQDNLKALIDSQDQKEHSLARSFVVSKAIKQVLDQLNINKTEFLKKISNMPHQQMNKIMTTKPEDLFPKSFMDRNKHLLDTKASFKSSVKGSLVLLAVLFSTDAQLTSQEKEVLAISLGGNFVKNIIDYGLQRKMAKLDKHVYSAFKKIGADTFSPNGLKGKNFSTLKLPIVEAVLAGNELTKYLNDQITGAQAFRNSISLTANSLISGLAFNFALALMAPIGAPALLAAVVVAGALSVGTSYSVEYLIDNIENQANFKSDLNNINTKL